MAEIEQLPRQALISPSWQMGGRGAYRNGEVEEKS